MRYYASVISACLGLGYLATSLAEPLSQHWESTLGLGFILNTPGINPALVNATDTETDRLQQTQNPCLLSYYVSLKRHLFTAPDQVWLQSIALGLSDYYTHLNTAGNVNQYESPLLSNYTYNTVLSSNDLLLESQWYFHALHHIAPFLQLGIGVAAVSFSYNEQPLPGIPDGQNLLGTRSQMNFAFDVGIGGRYAFTQQAGLTVQYLYLQNGSMHSNRCGPNRCVVAPLSATLNNSEILLGFNYQFA